MVASLRLWLGGGVASTGGAGGGVAWGGGGVASTGATTTINPYNKNSNQTNPYNNNNQPIRQQQSNHTARGHDNHNIYTLQSTATTRSYHWNFTHCIVHCCIVAAYAKGEKMLGRAAHRRGHNGLCFGAPRRWLPLSFIICQAHRSGQKKG